MKKCIYIIGVFVLLLSCKKDKLNDEKSFLVGTWNWSYTNHQYGWCDGESYEEILNPDSEKVNYSIHFQKNGKVDFFENENHIEVSRIVFDYFKENDDGSKSLVILLDNNENKKMSGYGGDYSMNFGRFPFLGEAGCEDYDNYFFKE